MRYQLAILAALGGIMVLSQGCASIVTRDRPVSITSQPTGAAFTIYNKKGEAVHEGTTPTTVALKRATGYFSAPVYTVEFQKAGCRNCKAEITHGISGWYIGGNFIFGGLIGWLIVDPLTGAMWTLKDLHVELESAPKAQMEDAVRIMALDQVPTELRSRLVRIN